jgi:hypothetical protein
MRCRCTLLAVTAAVFVVHGSAHAAPGAESNDAARNVRFHARIDLGLNAPSGFVALAAGARVARRHTFDASVGRGAAANFLTFDYRYALSDALSRWQTVVGLGGSVGMPNGDGYDPDQDSANPNTRTIWVHGEAGFERVGAQFVVLATAGVERLLTGRYHVDLAEVNVSDRRAGSTQLCLRLGVGMEF